jgi:hypothetical protein
VEAEQMQGRLKVSQGLAVLAVLLAAAAPMAAQKSAAPMAAHGAKSGQIFLVARMPETLTLALDMNGANGVADSRLAFDNAGVPSVATSVTATWVLALGRSHIVTWAHVKHPPAPLLLALATPIGISPYGDMSSDVPLAYNFAPRPSSSSRKLDVLNITDSNRAAASTVSLSDSIATPPQSAEDAYTGTVKIQVQVVP